MVEKRPVGRKFDMQHGKTSATSLARAGRQNTHISHLINVPLGQKERKIAAVVQQPSGPAANPRININLCF
jgi:hypothetical protein